MNSLSTHPQDSSNNAWTFNTSSAEETRLLGERLGPLLEEGDVICLFGGLGAGKTTLVQGIARGIGFAGRVTSPTFVVMHEYGGRVLLYHLDCYRLAGPEDLDELGAEEWMGRQGVTAIEWPERVLAALPVDRLELRLSDAGERHQIEVDAGGARSRELMNSLMQTVAGAKLCKPGESNP